MTNEKTISIIKNAFSWYEDNARESEEEDWSGQHEALRMAIKALEAQSRLTEMLNKQIDAYAEQHKGRDLSDLEYGRITAYEHCLEVLEDDE